MLWIMMTLPVEYESYMPRRYVYSVKYVIFLLLFLNFLPAIAQVPSSLSIHPYSGIDRIHLNPALGIQSLYTWDATIAGGHIFGQTDYSFVRKATLLNLGGQIRDATVIDAQSAIPESSNVPLILFDQNGGRKNMYLRGRINGPSVTFNIGSDMRVGVFSSFRAHMSSSDIPENFGLYELNLSYGTNIIDIDRGSASFASWLEIGGHISKQIENASFGINIKYIKGHEGGFIESFTDSDYDFIDSIVITSDIVEYEVGFTNSSINSGSLETDFNGSGIGIDLGYSYRSEILEFGASLSDIGIIKYKSNLEIYSPETLRGITQIRTQDYRGYTSVRNLIDQLQNDLNITPDNFGVFTIGLPTRLTLFADYKYDKNIFISGMINQRIPLFGHSLKSNNSLVITPRYETKWFSAFMPVTMQEYSSFRVGAAIRYGPFTIGSDHITSVFFPSDFKGSDFFFSLNIWPFGQEAGSGQSRQRGLYCPTF